MIHIQFESPYFSGIKSVDSDKKALSFLKILKRTHNKKSFNKQHHLKVNISHDNS